MRRFWLLVGLLTLQGASTAAAQRVSPAEEVVDDFLEAFLDSHVDACLRLFAPDATAHDYRWELAGFYVNERSETYLREWVCTPPDWYDSFEIEVLDRVSADGFVSQVQRATVVDEGDPPDAAYSLGSRLVTYEVRGGLIRNVWRYGSVGDTSSVPAIADPRYPLGEGPDVWFDEGHRNYHRPFGSYSQFSTLLARDGYGVRSWHGEFSDSLFLARQPAILVVANAMGRRNAEAAGWSLPTESAFSQAEIRAVQRWVERGGALLLIADHMPWGGAAVELGNAFGASLKNGIVRDSATGSSWLVFDRGSGLQDHEVTRGLDRVATFGGQGFEVSSEWVPLLTFGSGAVLWMPQVWRLIDEDTPRLPVEGWTQLAVRRFGQGRVAVSGEAGLFRYFGSDDVLDGDPDQNTRFVRSLVAWLVEGRVSP